MQQCEITCNAVRTISLSSQYCMGKTSAVLLSGLFIGHFSFLVRVFFAVLTCFLYLFRKTIVGDVKSDTQGAVQKL